METFLTDLGNEASAQLGLHKNQYTVPKIHRLFLAVASGPAGPVLAGPVFTVTLELRMRR